MEVVSTVCSNSIDKISRYWREVENPMFSIHGFKLKGQKQYINVLNKIYNLTTITIFFCIMESSKWFLMIGFSPNIIGLSKIFFFHIICEGFYRGFPDIVCLLFWKKLQPSICYLVLRWFFPLIYLSFIAICYNNGKNASQSFIKSPTEQFVHRARQATHLCVHTFQITW